METTWTAAWNIAIRTNCVQPKIDNTQRNSQCNLFLERDEKIHQIVSECGKLAPKDRFGLVWFGLVWFGFTAQSTIAD